MDRSLTVYLQRDRPGDDTAATNWLPAPETPFDLTMRYYGPGARILEGSYRLPRVTKTT